MKNWVKGAALGAVLIGLASFGAQAQVALTGTGGTVTYDFNSYLGTSAPTDWSIGSMSLYNGRTTGSSSTGGIYAMGTGSDYALGFLGSGGAAGLVASASISFANNTGGVLDSITLSWTAEDWRVQGRQSTLSFNSSIPGNYSSYTFTSPVGSTTGGSMAASQSYSITFTGLDLQVGDSFSFTWSYSGDGAGGSGSRSMVGLDDVVLTYSTLAIPEPSTYTLIGMGAGILVLAQLRRKKA